MQHFRRMEGSAVRRLRNLLAAAKTARDNHLLLRCLSDRRKQHQFSNSLRYDNSSVSRSLSEARPPLKVERLLSLEAFSPLL